MRCVRINPEGLCRATCGIWGRLEILLLKVFLWILIQDQAYVSRFDRSLSSKSKQTKLFFPPLHIAISQAPPPTLPTVSCSSLCVVYSLSAESIHVHSCKCLLTFTLHRRSSCGPCMHQHLPTQRIPQACCQIWDLSSFGYSTRHHFGRHTSELVL